MKYNSYAEIMQDIDKDNRATLSNEIKKYDDKIEYALEKIPSSLGECADMLMNIKTDRAKLKKQDDELKKYAGEIKDYVLECLEREGLTSSSGMNGCVTIGVTNRYSVGDKETFLKYVVENEGYDLINASCVSAPALSCRTLDNVVVPGVKCFEQTQIKLTKRKA